MTVLTIGNYSMRTLEEEDLQMVLRWRNRDDIRNVMVNNHEISWEEHQTWFNELKELEPQRYFVFCYKQRPIGYIAYQKYDNEKKVCNPGCYLGETNDVPLNAAMTLFYFSDEYAFFGLGVDRIETCIIENNKKAIKINRILGHKRNPEKDEILEGGRKALAVYMDKGSWDKEKEKLENLIG